MKKLISLSLFLFCSSLFLSGSVSAAPVTDKIVFPNGLTLIMRYDHDSDIVAVNLFLKTGSAEEEDGQAGLANLTASLLYRGTATRSAKNIAIQTESIGTSIGAACEDDYVSISSVVFKNYFSTMMEIFFDGLLRPSFPTEEVEKARQNILASLKTRNDNIFNVSMDLLSEKMYGDHPYHKPSAGYPRTVSALSRQQISSFYQKYYRPENMILVVVGDVSRSEIINMLEECFPDLKEPVRVETGFKPAPATPERFQAQDFTRETKFGQGYLMLGYLVPSVSSQEYPALKIISSLLGGGMNSRIFLNLREKEGLAYELDSFYPSRAYTSQFVVYLGLKSENIPKAYKLIRKEIDDLKNVPVSAGELNNIKTYLAGQFLLSHQTNASIAFYLGFFELLQKGYEYDAAYLEDLQGVTAADIQRITRNYFNDNNLSIIRLIPKPNQESGGNNE